MRTHLALLFLCYTAAGAAMAASVSGVVFHDANHNARFDDGEGGIPRVLVSNGTDVVATGPFGGFELPIGDATTIFVIQPRGWRVPVDEYNRARFHYIHNPAGSPPLEYGGVAPTGPLPERLEFPLHPADGNGPHRILLLGDPQPYNQAEVDHFARSTIAELAASPDITAVIVLGDIVGDDLSLFEAVSAAVARVGVPAWYVYGNHDMDFDAAEDETADDTFEATFGPATYAFQVGHTHFIVLDDVIYPYAGPRKYMGGLREDQFLFLENYLAHVPTDERVVLAMHIPLEDFGDTFRVADRERLFTLLADHPHTLSLSAHTHTQNHFFYDHRQGWPHPTPHHHYNVGTTSGSWWQGPPDADGVPVSPMRDGTPKGYALLTLEDTDYGLRYKATGRPAGEQMALFVPRVIPPSGWWPGYVYANVYNGEERTVVEWRVDDGPWRAMKHLEPQPDPIYSHRMFTTWSRHHPPRGKPLPAPGLSRHLWRARLPGGLPGGLHTVEVRVSDPYGGRFSRTTTFRVAE